MNAKNKSKIKIDSACPKQWGVTNGETPPWANTGIHSPCMVKAIKSFSSLLLLALLSGCASPTGGINKQDVGTVVGGVAGGVIGSQLFHGNSQIFGAVGGAIVGSLLGSAVGKSMDDQDRVNTTAALISTPIGQEAAWNNSQTGTSYVVRPVNEYNAGSNYCRKAVIYIDGGRDKAYTTVCKGSDGKWYMR